MKALGESVRKFQTLPVLVRVVAADIFASGSASGLLVLPRYLLPAAFLFSLSLPLPPYWLLPRAFQDEN